MLKYRKIRVYINDLHQMNKDSFELCMASSKQVNMPANIRN